MLLTQKHLRAGDFGISVFRSPGKGVPIMMELQAGSGEYYGAAEPPVRSS